MASIAPQATRPTQIGTRYTVLEQLGRGGTAIVYRAHDTAREVDVALKQLIATGDADKQRKLHAYFEREFYVLAQLSHPSVVQVYDFEIDASGPFYTMELLDGGDLNSRSPLPFRACCELAVQVCSALSFLHSRRYLHRDLSPRNVHCTRDGRAKLIDFGALVPMGLCRQIVGTPAFTAPEAIHGMPLDARTDLFSFGATLYFALTGRAPFAARAFEDLRAAWRDAPIPPSQLADDVPPELDLLVLSLLRVDPAHRPRSAFEVMQRLAAIAGIEKPEAADLSQAYLHTPTLVGRDVELQRFRKSAQRANGGKGVGLCVEGPPGSGRSRLLDAFVLEAKTQGMLAVRAAGASAKGPFGTVYDLAEQLLEASHDASVTTAREDGVFEDLFDATGDRPRLRPLAQIAAERDKLSPALTTFIHGVCRTRPVLIAVDDAERVDEASLALLAAFAHAASERALVVAVAVTSPAAAALPALDVLASHCERIRLRALNKSELESLFSSVFGPVPNVALVSDRIAAVSMGNPSAAMTIAQHMVDQQRIRYAEGSWLLPAELTLTELPADAEELLRARVANLPPLARRLAELQALAISGQFGRADYAELAGPGSAAQLDAALDLLVQRGVLSTDGHSYALLHGGDRALLLAGLSAERTVEHHATLAEHFASVGPDAAQVHHLLMAGQTDRALDLLVHGIATADERADVALSFRMSATDIAATLEEGLRRSIALGRPLREQHEIARLLVTLSVITDNKLHARYSEFWQSRLELDTGLTDYRGLDPSLPAPERLKRALDAAVARYVATPERDRVYRVDEAIRYMARYVSISVAIGARTRNVALLHAIPDLLEPFAPLAPLLHVLWQNAISAYEMNFRGTVERARGRAIDLYERLGQLQGDDQYYANVIRSAIAAALALIESALGLASAEQWIEVIETDPLQRVNAMYIRRIWCIIDGDVERAEYYRTRAELFALQAITRQMFMAPVRHELNAHLRAGDLAATKQAVDQIARLAEDAPGWLPQRYVAQGAYQRLRGDLASAQAEFERAIQASIGNPQEALRDRLSWVAAVAGYVGVLAARGRAQDARTFGRAALTQCEAHGIQGAAFDLVRELAVAEAKAGEYAVASERLEKLIAREGARESHRVVDYEARVRVAIEARDPDAATRYLELLARHARPGAGYTAQPRHAQLSEEARRVGVTVDLPETSFQTAVLSPRTSRHLTSRTVATALSTATDAPERAQRALALLCEAAGGGQGWLYLAHETGLFLAASHALPPDATIDASVRRYWLELGDAEEDADISTHTGETSATNMQGGDYWLNDEKRLRPVILRSNQASGSRRIGIAVLASSEDIRVATHVSELAGALGTRLLELGDAHGVTLE